MRLITDGSVWVLATADPSATPDFPLNLTALTKSMRLSLMKAAPAGVSRVV
jgi:hypothetical protein